MAQPRETMIQLVVPKEEPEHKEIISINVDYILKEIKRRRKINFLLNEAEETNRKKLELIQLEARKLKYTFDTSTVILIRFSENFSYGEFVKLLNLCLFDSIQRYVTLDNCFAIFGEYPPRKIVTDSAVTCLFCGDVISIEPPKKTFKDVIIGKLKPYTNSQSISLLLTWLILTSTFLYCKKRLNSFH
jgi:hypothetical protein